jgi:hypothetical protein
MDDTRPRMTTATIGSALRERAAEARYPALFTQPHTGGPRPGLGCTVRGGTGIVVISVLHGVLTPTELAAISEYRLQQYVLSGMYDERIVAQLGLEQDPGVELLADTDVHVAVGDVEGRFLCYMCMQSPLLTGEYAHATAASFWRLRDTRRPAFPVESEYGLGIYGEHPDLGPLPIHSVRELTRLVRNQVLRTPVDLCTVVEAVLAVARAMSDLSLGIDAIVGCASREVRRALYRLGVPMMYAPHALILGENLGAEIEGHLLWTEQSHIPGRFWPFALLSADVCLDVKYFDRLDVALARPAPEVMEALAAVQPSGLLRRPSLLRAAELIGGVLWTDDPEYVGAT